MTVELNEGSFRQYFSIDSVFSPSGSLNLLFHWTNYGRFRGIKDHSKLATYLTRYADMYFEFIGNNNKEGTIKVFTRSGVARRVEAEELCKYRGDVFKQIGLLHKHGASRFNSVMDSDVIKRFFSPFGEFSI
jgi:hypothetical protein